MLSQPQFLRFHTETVAQESPTLWLGATSNTPNSNQSNCQNIYIHKQKPEQLIIHFAGFLAAALRFGFSGSAAAFAWAFAWALALASADRLVDLVGALVGTVFGKIGLERQCL